MKIAEKQEKVKKNIDYYLKKIESLSGDSDKKTLSLLKKRLRRAQRKLKKYEILLKKLEGGDKAKEEAN